MSIDRGVRIEDVAALRSRVSWAAVFGGGVIALAVYLVLSLLFAGVGLSMTEAGVRAGAVTWVEIIAGIVSLLVALFVGGWVTTQLTAGETRQEAWIHGVLTWAVVTAVAVGMVGMGMRGGYNALLGAALVANEANANWEAAARQSGIPQERIDQWKQGLNPENLRNEVQRPENVAAARRAAMIAAWSTLAGTLLSIGAAILGAFAGMGPSFRLFPAAVVTEQQVTSTTVTR
jgi:uncharacterized Tic20 family protein